MTPLTNLSNGTSLFESLIFSFLPVTLSFRFSKCELFTGDYLSLSCILEYFIYISFRLLSTINLSKKNIKLY